MANSKKLIVPVVALMLCAVAVIGVGYAYQGIYNDTSEEATLDVHWVKVGSGAQITIDTDAIIIDANTETSGYGAAATTTYTFDTTQQHLEAAKTAGKLSGYTATADTLTLTGVKIGVLNFAAADGAAQSGTLAATITSGSATGITIAKNAGMATSWAVTSTVDVLVDITISKTAITENNGTVTVSIPAITLAVTATAGTE